MKKMNVKNSLKLFLTAATFFMMSSCQAPNEREAKVNPKVAGGLVGINDVCEATNKQVCVQGSKKEEVQKLDSELKQSKIDGSQAEIILSKISNPDVKDLIEKQLSSGSITFLILRDEVKVFKITPEIDVNLDYDVLSSKYLAKMKEYHKASDVTQQLSKLRELREIKYISPRSQGEKFGLVELASVKVAKFGVLDNVYTDYKEKKSILDIKETPFEMATHILLAEEEKK
jgi:hypothetical protein